MSALADEYIAIYGSDRIINISNPSSPESATQDTTRIEKAALAAIKDFETIVGISFDETDQEHLTICVDGVDAWLDFRTPSIKGGKQARKDYREELEAVRLRKSAHAIAPKTNSNYVPSTHPTGRPPLDSVSFDRLRMNPPRTSSVNDRNW